MKIDPKRLSEAREALGINQSELARRLGVTPQAVQSWEAGKSSPRGMRLAELCSALGVGLSQILDGPLLDGVLSGEFAPIIGPALRAGIDLSLQHQAEIAGAVEEWDDDTPLGDDVAIPFLKEVELAAGSGRTAVEVSTDRRLRFGKYSLKKKNVQAEHAVAVTVRGNSMEPNLPDGATVAVNTADTAITDGKTYAINHAGQLRVKLLYRLPGGGLRVRSYNRDEHPDEEYTPAQIQEQEISVIGRVFWGAMFF